ncbi:hypothetical protein E3N88_27651 [Mikania micrantha]|uniref:Uncharacterized protein n=1 Tax=Mikania micrantha TaxID=192012 RepID=A0A5N6MYB7_9ASTR|nr:hypothetical protein E3N88_27651 [Mikania micrantha]
MARLVFVALISSPASIRHHNTYVTTVKVLRQNIDGVKGSKGSGGCNKVEDKGSVVIGSDVVRMEKRCRVAMVMVIAKLVVGSQQQ